MIETGTPNFDMVLRFIEEQTGIRLPETNYRQVRTYLQEKTAEAGVAVQDYLSGLRFDHREREAFLDAVTINETYFFREERHFAVLEQHIFPALKARSAKPLRFWSAACSTGEEALSLASLAAGFWEVDEFTVYASDINTRALEHLRRGEYGKNSFRNDGGRFRGRLDTFIEERNGKTRVSDDLLKTLEIVPLNLSDREYDGIPEGLHAVFLRNMLIYTRFELRTSILEKITALLAEGGCLFLSSSEVPLLAHPDLALENREGCYYFRKKTLEEKRAGTTPRVVILQKEPAPAEPAGSASTKTETSPTLAEILRHAGRRLNNPVYEAPGDNAFLAAMDYLEAVYFLNSGDASKAEGAVEKLVRDWDDNEVIDYLRGLICLRKEDPGRAKEWFSRAVKRDPGFWPAVFQRALLIRQEEPDRAAREFAAALRSIEAYIARGSFTYQFLLEGFNAKYFAGICEGWITKLRSKGAAHGA